MTTTAPAPGELSLHDAFEPSIKDGSYSAAITQTVTADGATVAPVTQLFEVAGPRFVLDPSEIHSQFPPVGSSGPHQGTLANVTLSTRLLPWERDIPGLATTVPWLALLVFEAGDLLGDRGTGDYAQTMSVSTLLANPSGPIRVPAVTPTTTEAAQQCRVITLTSRLFAQIVPTAAELPLLAHVRSLDPGQSAVSSTNDPGTFSVVISNRFPEPGDATHGKTAIAHLVSLEGFGDLLSGVAPVAPTQSEVRLVSLASWTFSCLAEPSQTFTALAEQLSRAGGTPAAPGPQRSADSLLLKLPIDEPAASANDPASQAQRRLAEGYTAAGYHSSSGEDGFAWYRGPLVPVVPGAAPTGPGFQTSAAAMAFDPATGIFDHHLAAAWELGRGLALASEAFATALMRLRAQANAELESSLAPDPHAALSTMFDAGTLAAIGEASGHGRIDPAPRRQSGRQARTADEMVRTGAQALRAALSGTPPPLDPCDGDVVTVIGWLASLQLLVPVPLAHLVPDTRMLPEESLRSFYIDPEWVSAAIDGALSIGVGTSRDLAVQGVLTDQLRTLAAAHALALRANQLGTAPPPASANGWTGILVRSAIVSGWPGLTVTATAKGTPVPLLRLDHLAPGLLIALFDGVPDTVILGEPFQGLSFGVDDSGFLVMRSLSAPVGAQVGTLQTYVPGSPSEIVRAGDQRVINVSSGSSDLVHAIHDALGLPAATALGPADLGLQLLNVPEQVVFSSSLSTERA